MITVFFYEHWQFYSSLLFLLVVAHYFKPFWLLLLGFILAIFSVSVHYWLFYKQPELEEEQLQAVSIEARIEKTFSDDYLRIRLTKIAEESLPWYRQVFANVALKDTTNKLESGLYVKALAKLNPYRSRKNFDSFDGELYAFTQKLHYKGQLTQIQSFSTAKANVITVYRQWLWQNLDGYQLSWLYYTLLSGDKSQISAENKQRMQQLGLSHMLAISGLHVGIVYALGFYMSQCCCFFASLFGVRYSQLNDLNRYYAFAGLTFSILYVLLSGLAVSALRALLMLSVLVIAYFFARQIINYRVLLFALCGVLLVDPFSVLNPGLYFSFIAVYCIFSFVRMSANKINAKHFATQLILLQLILGVLLAPLSSYYFYGISVSSLITNIVFIPLLTFLLLPALALLLISFLCGFTFNWFALIDEAIFVILKQLTELLLDAGWLKTQPFAWQYLVIFYLSILLFTHCKVWRAIAMIPIVMGITNAISEPQIKWQIDVIDVGHGTAVLITVGKQALLYDLGAKYFDRFSIFERVVKPYLEANNLQLSQVILSHQDNDHVGGINELLAYIGSRPLNVFHNGKTHTSCNIIQTKFAQILTVESLWPSHVMSSDNNNSCVVKVSDGHYSLLLTGDIERIAEQLLVKQASSKLSSDILLVPHHGSNTSSSNEFISAVHPQIAIYSRSYYSIWHLPHPKVVERYNQASVTQLDTALEGQIRIKVTKSGLLIGSARKSHQFWFL
ncbi:DNA internalization-related competence protein ComEC/Rec2 [Pseudoalteromonas sp. S16_S37]|uniref:DNA internalization-related competence protein ComEC/Rec2 n=1 Tax=Pseudoalteromonas sp. S16_S37 TaxID=2720228 RepID=UPI001680E8C5|nr:DNA internalization-related competence protein ComEC/Rec2 [Pseudoalteromonas sp. S16_S37]MBD1581414.1 DNA internalization-related competence protein ComEC/Rec2 [Pseudoalteromonas sp. S16_S37]